MTIPDAKTSLRCSEDYSQPRYGLSNEELKTLEHEMVEFAERRTADKGFVAVWINPYHRYANFVRTHEARYFPEVAELSGDDEAQTLFYAMLDTRECSRRIVHAATLCTVTDAIHQGQETGLFTIDSLIENGNFTKDDFIDFYLARGIDPKSCLSIETNFRVGEPAQKYNGLSATDLSYLLFFRQVISRGGEKGSSGIFATINSASEKSFQRVGIYCEPLMGRTDFITPESHLGVDSKPVFIPYSEHADHMYEMLMNFGIRIPELSAT